MFRESFNVARGKAVSKAQDLITFKSKGQVVVSLGSYEALFAQGRHEV